jgi:hypothetical protein
MARPVQLISKLVILFVDELFNVFFFKQGSRTQDLACDNLVIGKMVAICNHLGTLLLFREWNISAVDYRCTVHW